MVAGCWTPLDGTHARTHTYTCTHAELRVWFTWVCSRLGDLDTTDGSMRQVSPRATPPDGRPSNRYPLQLSREAWPANWTTRARLPWRVNGQRTYSYPLQATTPTVSHALSTHADKNVAFFPRCYVVLCCGETWSQRYQQMELKRARDNDADGAKRAGRNQRRKRLKLSKKETSCQEIEKQQ